MALSLGIGLHANRVVDAISSGLIHDWRFVDTHTGIVSDRVGTVPLTIYGGVGLSYDGATDGSTSELYDLRSIGLDTSTTATIGAWIIPTAGDGVVVGGQYYYGLPLGIQYTASDSKAHVRGLQRISGGSLVEFKYSVSGVTSATAHSIVFVIDVNSATPVTCYLDGVSVAVTATVIGSIYAITSDSRLAVLTDNWRNRYTVGAGSTTSDRVFNAAYTINAVIGRTFITSLALAKDQIDQALICGRGGFPAVMTAANSRVYMNDNNESGSVDACPISGSELSHHHSSYSSAVAGGDSLPIPWPQRIGGWGTYDRSSTALSFTPPAANGFAAQTTALNYVTTASLLTVPTAMTIMFYGRVLATSTANSVVFDMAEGSSYGVKVYTQYSGGNTLRVQMLSHGGGEIASITSAQLGDTMNGVAIVADPATATTRIYSGTVASSSLTLRYTTAAGINDLSTSSATFTVLGSEVTSVTGRNTALGRILVYNRALSVAEINVNHNIMRGAYAS